MGKYHDALNAVFSIFETPSWKLENIKAFPSNFNLKNASDKFIRIDVIPSGRGINLKSVSGILAIDIFTAAGSGPKGTLLIADALDKFLVGKTFITPQGCLQTLNSSYSHRGLDPVNPTLSKAVYSVPFNFYGVL
jgi:hypothetical protein